MNIIEVKRNFLDHFETKGYSPTDSSPLIVSQMPTAFVMSVGLLQLNAILTPHADEKNFPPFCMIQRCFRHYDMEIVGTGNRLSFFEMAGAISSGDRSQAQVLSSLKDFLTDVVGLDGEHLVFSTFSGGDFLGHWMEADKVSLEALAALNVPEARIFLGDASTNFFGRAPRDNVCGPAVEVFFDRGRQPQCPEPSLCKPGCSCQRYVEVATCVFLAYRKGEGRPKVMPRIYCEAAVGVERLAFVSSGLASIYDLPQLRDVGLFLIEHGLLFPHVICQENRDADICSDHLRAAVYALADGASPGRSGRPHLLRKLIRRFFARTVASDSLIDHLPSLVRLVAKRNHHILPMTEERIRSIVDALASEAKAYYESLKAGRTESHRYLKGSMP